LKKLGVAFLGVAYFHAENYATPISQLETYEVVGFYEANRKFAKEFATKYNFKHYEDLDKLLNESKLDAVIVTSETSRHHEFALAAADHQKHILCEKPLALSLKESDEMNLAARRAGIRFQMCHVIRHHPAAVQVHDLIENDRLGTLRFCVGTNKINVYNIFRRRWLTDPRFAGGGAVIDHTVHLSDTMRWFTGSEVVEVYTQIGKNLIENLQVEDNFLTTLTFSNGTIGHADGSWSYPNGYPIWGDFRMEVIGTNGTIMLDAFGQNISFFGMKPPSDKHSLQSFGPNANRELLKNFAGSILNDEKPATSWIDGHKNMEIVLASYKSAKLHKPVRIR
jgi:predicted dehydrogenase